MEYICKPARLRLYVNTGYKTANEVMLETGCTAIINGGLYDLTSFKPVCRLRVSGQTLADDGYRYWGYGWDDGPPALTQELTAHANYICCVCLVREGKAEQMYIAPALAGSRARTAMGRYPDGRLWLYASDKTLTPYELQALALERGLRDAVMLDGGGSTQGIFPAGEGRVTAMYSPRRVHNYICVWEDKETMLDIEYIPITKSDVWSSTRTIKPAGLVLHSTAMPGVGAYALQANSNRAGRGASIHGCVDDKHIVQCLPWTKRAGHVGSGKNGSYNNSHIGIEMCEPSGLTYNSNGSVIMKYNPPAGYFAAVWKNAVDLFAYLCKEYGLDPLGKNVIVSHAEAHALGYGDNHADTGHWFKWEGVTMDDFRQAVADAMKEEDDDMSYEQFKEYMKRYMDEAEVTEPSKWAKDACETAIAKGVMQGNGTAYNFQKPLTREAYLVMQDRQGLL